MSPSRRSHSPPTPITLTGTEAGLEDVCYYDPPNMTYPFGSYIVVVEVDTGDGTWKVLDMVAVDDCGVRINPMIVAGQITGGLTEGFAKATNQWITFDEQGNCIGTNFLDYLVPTAWETPRFRLGATVTPSPHHPDRSQRGRRVGDGRGAGGVRQRRGRRPLVARRDRPRHAGPAPPGVGRHQRCRRQAVVSGVVPSIDVLRAGRRGWSRRRLRLRTATVTWRRGPSSGKAGAKAIVLADGTVEGWLGGACARPTVVAAALESLVDGQPRLLVLGEHDHRPEVVTVAMACSSEGAMEVFVEPQLPAPDLRIIGSSPMVTTLAELAEDARLACDCHRRARSRRSRARTRGSSSPPRVTTTNLPSRRRWQPRPDTSAWLHRRSGPGRSCPGSGRRASATRTWPGFVHRPASI